MAVSAALKLSADPDDADEEKWYDERRKWKAEWDDKIKQRVLHADGTPKTKAQYGGIQAVYRVVKEEVEHNPTE